MIAAVLEQVGEKIEIKEIETPILGEGEVLIEIKASAINHRDIYISKGQYASIKTPCVLGSDASGEVIKVGNENLNSILGKSVIINPNINWGENENFQGENYQILGMPTNGTFAQYVKVNSDRIFEKPNHLNFQEAASLPLAGLTAFRAVFTKGQLKSNQKILINGVGGGVAQFAFLFAKAIGADVIVTSGSHDKLEQALKMGAKAGFNYKDQNFFKQIIAQFGGVDLVIDSAGGDGFSDLLKVLNPGGKIVTYGGTRGKISNLSPQILFWKQASILGTTMGSDQDFEAMLNFVNAHQLKPSIGKVFELSQINEAFDFIEAQEQFGKVVISL